MLIKRLAAFAAAAAAALSLSACAAPNEDEIMPAIDAPLPIEDGYSEETAAEGIAAPNAENTEDAVSVAQAEYSYAPDADEPAAVVVEEAPRDVSEDFVFADGENG